MHMLDFNQQNQINKPDSAEWLSLKSNQIFFVIVIINRGY
jgi:hypothetical protein